MSRKTRSPAAGPLACRFISEQRSPDSKRIDRRFGHPRRRSDSDSSDGFSRDRCQTSRRAAMRHAPDLRPSFWFPWRPAPTSAG